MQIATFIDGLFASGQASTVLIVNPVSLLPNWIKEMQTWAPDVRLKVTKYA